MPKPTPLCGRVPVVRPVPEVSDADVDARIEDANRQAIVDVAVASRECWNEGLIASADSRNGTLRIDRR